MNILILLPHPFELWNAPPWFRERLEAEYPWVSVTQRNSYAEAASDLAEAEILLAWSLRAEQFRTARKLRWIHSPAAAVHGLMNPDLISSPVVVTNGASVNGPVVAEHTIALILALAKRLDSAFRYQAARQWGQQKLWEGFPRPREIAGATLGLIGLGHIGGAVACLAAGLGMRVLGVREHPERGADWLPTGADREGHRTFGPADMDEVIAACDYLVLAAPLTPSTRTLIKARRLALMKPHACFINVSRGALVDEQALVEALRARRIGGAALDVFTSEPLPADSPLWDLDNVLITPHSAAISERLWERQYALFSENLRRYLRGEPLLSVVDKQKGY